MLHFNLHIGRSFKVNKIKFKFPVVISSWLNFHFKFWRKLLFIHSRVLCLKIHEYNEKYKKYVIAFTGSTAYAYTKVLIDDTVWFGMIILKQNKRKPLSRRVTQTI